MRNFFKEPFILFFAHCNAIRSATYQECSLARMYNSKKFQNQNVYKVQTTTYTITPLFSNQPIFEICSVMTYCHGNTSHLSNTALLEARHLFLIAASIKALRHAPYQFLIASMVRLSPGSSGNSGKALSKCLETRRWTPSWKCERNEGQSYTKSLASSKRVEGDDSRCQKKTVDTIDDDDDIGDPRHTDSVNFD